VIRSADPSYGGPLAGVRETARELNRRGHTVHILTLDGPHSPAIQDIDVPLFAAGSSYLSYGYAPRLKPWLRSNASRYDAIILNGIWEYSSVGSWRALRKAGVPYFLYTHGMLDPWFETRRVAHWKKTAYWKLWEHRVLRDAAAVLFTSEEEQRLAPSSFAPYRCEQRVVSYGTAPPPEGADTQAAKFYAEFPDLRGRRIVLFLGRLHPKKGCDLLLRAFAELKHRDPRLHLVMAGPGEPRFVHKLRRLAHQLTIADRTTWTGGLFGDLKWGALHCADLFVCRRTPKISAWPWSKRWPAACRSQFRIRSTFGGRFNRTALDSPETTTLPAPLGCCGNGWKQARSRSPPCEIAPAAALPAAMTFAGLAIF
jgi:glycosyltransferase involved in cell wall biosynthesis